MQVRILVRAFAAAALLANIGVASASERLAIACANVEHIDDGDAKLSFYFDADAKTWRGIYHQQSFMGAKSYSLNVCSESSQDPRIHTEPRGRLTCHDSHWKNSYTAVVDLGGWAGIGDATVYFRNAAGETDQLLSLPCRFVGLE